MIRYVALLRGVNVSGKNMISMPLVRNAFAEYGFADVRTYINSGNVVFSSDEADAEALSGVCSGLLFSRFGLSVPVVVLPERQLREILQNAPDWWDAPAEEEVIHQLIVLIPPVTLPQICEAVGEARPEYERVEFRTDAVYWSAPRKTLSRSRWYKIASSRVNMRVTIRNASTMKKLLALCEAAE